jgi:alkylation response protein AidB-like acyl-CoA dehydrogenase
MEFDLSKPQQLLRESAREVFARQCPMERVRTLMAGETAFDEELWHTLADQGWLGLHLPEAVGGLGLGLVDLAVVVEEMGRACVPGPFLATLWAATLLAHASDRAAPPPALESILAGDLRATVALLEPENGWDPQEVQLGIEKDDGGYRLSGRKMAVLDAADAGLIVCAGRHDNQITLLSVRSDAPGVTLTATPALDATRKLYQVDFAGAVVPAADVLASGDRARAALERSVQLATVAVCAELVGIVQRVLEMSVDYAKTRQQFDRPIGAFQAVQHQCADMLLLTESARSAAYYAAWALSANAPDAPRALAIAKAYASDAARDVCHHAIQVHGGVGFTWEHDLHIYFKRARADGALFGDATFHREQIARLILDAGPARDV